MVNVSVDKDGSAKETLKTAIKKRKTKLTSHDDKASVGNEVNVVGAGKLKFNPGNANVKKSEEVGTARSYKKEMLRPVVAYFGNGTLEDHLGSTVEDHKVKKISGDVSKTAIVTDLRNTIDETNYQNQEKVDIADDGKKSRELNLDASAVTKTKSKNEANTTTFAEVCKGKVGPVVGDSVTVLKKPWKSVPRLLPK
ncbi:unnamed protein product [Ambrosiozyma monospora]|uniref:Unnamed protein product n=1 Tax=Ambrosiozyma monospora TaxID=43982 RepID=A0ACB5TUX8_AMBMO|nr:unnamed protein product [Ambrosiozyma monospora]